MHVYLISITLPRVWPEGEESEWYNLSVNICMSIRGIGCVDDGYDWLMMEVDAYVWDLIKVKCW